MVLPEAEWCNNLKAETFVSLSRMGALTEKLLARAHSRAPWRLFLIVLQPDIAETILATPKCLLDKWTARFLEENDITSSAARSKLMLHIMMLRSSTNDLEVGHSHIRRMVKRRIQCAPADVADISAKWVVHQCRRHHYATGERKGGQQADAHAGQQQRHEELKARGGGAGPWRAFCRLQRSNNLKEVGRKYNELKAHPDSEVLRQCREEGAAAATRRRSSGVLKGETSFGPKHKKLEALQLQAAVVPHTQQLATKGLECALENLLDDARLYGHDLGQTINMVRKLKVTSDRARAADLKRDEETLVAFSAQRAAFCNELLHNVPGLPSKSRSMTTSLSVAPGPWQGMPLLEVDETPAIADGDELAQLSDDGDHHCNLMREIAKNWDHLHRLHPHPDDGHVSSDDDPPASAATPCWLAGTCICQPSAAPLRKMRNHMLRTMKAEVPAKDELWKRELLKGGRIFMRLQPTILGDTENDSLAEFWGIAAEEQWWHISHMSFSPYEPEVQPMSIASDEEVMGAYAGPGEVTLKALGLHVPTFAQAMRCEPPCQRSGYPNEPAHLAAAFAGPTGNLA